MFSKEDKYLIKACVSWKITVQVDWFVNFLRSGGAYPAWITLSRKLTRQVPLIDVLEVVGHVLHESRARLIRLRNLCSVRMTSHSRTKVSDKSLVKLACLWLQFTGSLKGTCRGNVWNEHGHKNWQLPTNQLGWHVVNCYVFIRQRW